MCYLCNVQCVHVIVVLYFFILVKTVYLCSYHHKFILRYVNQLVYNAWCVTYFSKEINYIHIKFKWGGLQWGLGQR